MINAEMAKDYALRAKRCLKEAELAFSENDAPMTVRRSQEALELYVKALLRALAIEYPREHDVSEALTSNADRLSGETRTSVDELVKLIGELAALRGPALYGYEREGIPASRAFTLNYASEILEKVKEYTGVIAKSLKLHIG